jgi:hypothetical protein
LGFITNFWFLSVIRAVFNGFSPFLGDIGHFLSLIFVRKLEMSNQLPSYNPGLFEAMGGIQSRVMLRRSQAKAILR